MLGIIFVILGAVGDAVSFAFAAQSVVAPLAGLALVSNLCFARWFLGEYVGKTDVIGSCMIVLGVAGIVAFGSHNSPTYTLVELVERYTQPGMVALLVLAAIAVVAMKLVIRRAEGILVESVQAEILPANSDAGGISQARNDSGHHAEGHVELSVIAPVSARAPPPPADSNASSTVSPPTAPKKPHSSPIAAAMAAMSDGWAPAEYEPFCRAHPLSYALVAGVFGSGNTLLAKSFMELLRTTVDGDNQLVYPVTWVIALALAGTIVGQQDSLARGLQLFPSSVIVPVFQTMFIVGSIACGAVYFSEFESFSLLQWFMFPLGVLLCIAGVMVMTAGAATHYHDAGSEELEEGGPGAAQLQTRFGSADEIAGAPASVGSSLPGSPPILSVLASEYPPETRGDLAGSSTVALTHAHRRRSSTVMDLLPPALLGERLGSPQSAPGRRRSLLRADWATHLASQGSTVSHAASHQVSRSPPLPTTAPFAVPGGAPVRRPRSATAEAEIGRPAAAPVRELTEPTAAPQRRTSVLERVGASLVARINTSYAATASVYSHHGPDVQTEGSTLGLSPDGMSTVALPRRMSALLHRSTLSAGALTSDQTSALGAVLEIPEAGDEQDTPPPSLTPKA